MQCSHDFAAHHFEKKEREKKQNTFMMLGAGGRGRARGHGRSRGRGDGTLPKPPSHSREFASVVGGALMPKRRGGAAMAEVLEEEQPEPSFCDPSSIELDDEHIAEEIKEVAASKGKEEHDEGEEDDEEDDKEDDKESDEDEMEGSEPKVKRGRGQEAVRRKKKKWSRGKRRTSAVHFFFEKGDSDGVFVCKLHAFMPKGSGHPQHVRQGGPGTSNLLSHARCYHEKALTGLVKAWNEGRDLQAEWDGMVALLQPPPRHGMDRFVSVVSKSEAMLRRELSLLIFLIANSLSFNVLDSLHFETFVSSMGGAFPSRKSLVELLPSLSTVVLSLLESKFVESGFFLTTFDLWTSIAGTKYCVITYHSMSRNFELFSAPLDFVPLSCSAFSEFLFYAIETRLLAHPFGSLVHTASFTDSGSNVQAAKEMLVEGDAEPCFNHDLKLVIDYVLTGTDAHPPTAPRAALDLNGLALCIAYIRSSSILCQQFEAIQHEEGDPHVQLVEANLTRWEGRYRLLERAVKLARSLSTFHQRSLLQPCLEKSPSHFPSDLFQRSFWRRLRESYEPLLQVFHRASKGAQAKGTPTLSTIPYHYYSMCAACAPVADDPQAVVELKNALQHALEERMAKYVTVVCRGGDGSNDLVPNAIKAAILDPRFSAFIQGKLDPDQIMAVRESIIADTLTVIPRVASPELAESVMQSAFAYVLQKLQSADVAESGDVLPWWKDFFAEDASAGLLCANFSWSVRMYLSMPAGEAPSEQVLSVATDIVTKKRNRLSDQTIEQLLIVHHFVKSDWYNFETLVAQIKDKTKK